MTASSPHSSHTCKYTVWTCGQAALKSPVRVTLVATLLPKTPSVLIPITRFPGAVQLSVLAPAMSEANTSAVHAAPTANGVAGATDIGIGAVSSSKVTC